MPKKIFTILTAVIFTLSISSALYVNAASTKKIIKNPTFAQQKEIDKFEKKIELRIKDAKNDVIKTHKIDMISYIEFNLAEIDELPKKGVHYFIDNRSRKNLMSIIVEWDSKLPNGAVHPTILLNKNKCEVLYAFKDENGNNIVWSATNEKNINSKITKSDKIEASDLLKNDSGWRQEEKNIKGSPVLGID